MSTKIIAEIQIGEITINHDQDITPVNFKTTNTIVKSPMNPMPPFDDAVFDILSPYVIHRYP